MDPFINFRPEPIYSPYPIYHTGSYLEPFFYNYLKTKHIDLKISLIPVYWTICYLNKKIFGLQNAINKLDNDQYYFAVSQHDDAIKEKLPRNTLRFCAGGNSGGIPIPLVCSSIPKKDISIHSSKIKDLLCSFQGSETHILRSELLDEFKNKKKCIVSLSKWTRNTDPNKYYQYINIASRSKFLLCPRGYGLQSFRLYESFQLGCVPVIITDKRFLPWEDELDWNSFSIVTNSCINLYDKLNAISDNEYHSMLNIGQKLYNKYFTLVGTCEQIIKRIQQIQKSCDLQN